MLLPRTAVAAVLLVLLCSGCSANQTPDIGAGWQWTVNSGAAYTLDAETDSLTGELILTDGNSDTGLALPSTAASADAAVASALDDAQAAMCSRYVEPYGDDPIQEQGFEIRQIMFATMLAAQSSYFSDEYKAAYRETDAFVDKNGPSLDGVEFDSAEWDSALDARTDLWNSHWADKHSGVADERKALIDEFKAISLSVNSSETVRAIQEMYISKCDLTVADDYEFPTPNELGIKVDAEYIKSLTSPAP
ncbi:MAG: hypothetical protein NVV57_04245 [Demequina sp.]|nr:hypothetical protein [Demequina sp.]